MHCRTLADVDRLDGTCQAITITLDKAGGLTEAFALAAEATRRGFRIMVGGVIGTSLGIAPALSSPEADISSADFQGRGWSATSSPAPGDLLFSAWLCQ